MTELFDPFRFSRQEIRSQKDQVMLERLRQRIREFEDLAYIEKWEDVKADKSVCKRLQKAHDVMHDYHFPEEVLKHYRCIPCEIEGLCGIRNIVLGTDNDVEYGKQMLEYLDIKLDPKTIKKNIENWNELLN